MASNLVSSASRRFSFASSLVLVPIGLGPGPDDVFALLVAVVASVAFDVTDMALPGLFGRSVGFLAGVAVGLGPVLGAAAAAGSVASFLAAALSVGGAAAAAVLSVGFLAGVAMGLGPLEADSVGFLAGVAMGLGPGLAEVVGVGVGSAIVGRVN